MPRPAPRCSPTSMPSCSWPASGAALTEHLLIDLTAATSTPRGIRALHNARFLVERHGLHLALIGADRLGSHLTPGERAVLRGLRNFPNLDSALAELPCATARTAPQPATAGPPT